MVNQGGSDLEKRIQFINDSLTMDEVARQKKSRGIYQQINKWTTLRNHLDEILSELDALDDKLSNSSY